MSAEPSEGDIKVIQNEIAIIARNIDVFFLIINAIIVFFMQCGFAFLECGAVRSKNATNILMKNMMDAFIAGVAYWFIGLGIMFGGGNSFIGTNYFMGYNLPTDMYALWFFHYVFAATAATIVSGAVAERCNMLAYGVYSFVITGVVYPTVTHWAWAEEGWLKQGQQYRGSDGSLFLVNFQDFAGSGVVHLLGGTCSLVACGMLGPRLGRFKGGQRQEIQGHSVPLAALGGFILFTGFLSFNGGSQGSMSQPGDGNAVAVSCVNTVLAGSFGAISALVTLRIMSALYKKPPHWSFLTTINGGLTGMVAICAGCNVLKPYAAAVIGMIAGWVFLYVSRLLLKYKFDDPLDAVAVHGGGGLWGVFATPLLSYPFGVVYNIGSKEAWLRFGWNMAGAAAIISWSAVFSLIMFGLLRYFDLLRVTQDIEMFGLDITKHGEPAYPHEAYARYGAQVVWYWQHLNRPETGRVSSPNRLSTQPAEWSPEKKAAEGWKSGVKASNSVEAGNDTPAAETAIKASDGESKATAEAPEGSGASKASKNAGTDKGDCGSEGVQASKNTSGHGEAGKETAEQVQASKTVAKRSNNAGSMEL